MVQDVVVGTLATLNILVSPLSPGAMNRQVYRFELETSPMIEEDCTIDAKLERSHLTAQVQGLTEEYFNLGLKAQVCTANFGPRKVSINLNLPTEVIDESFWDKLKPGQSYVVRGIPSAGRPDLKENIKLTRLEDEGVLMGLQIEAIPASAATASHGRGPSSEIQPLVIWADRSAHGFSEVPGFTRGSLHWKRLMVNYRPTPSPQSLVLSGELKRVENSPSKKR